MKKIIAVSMLGFIISTAFNKPAILLSDYRDAYTGNYFCTRSCERMKTSPNASTTYTDTLTIGVAKDALDSILKITIGQSTYRAKLKNNTLHPYTAGARFGGKFFSTDSISFMSSGLGNLCSYRGKKK